MDSIAKEAENRVESNNEALLQKDSKRSWLVCVGAIFLVGIAMGLSNSFGVILASWTREFEDNRTKIGGNSSYMYISNTLCAILIHFIEPQMLRGSYKLGYIFVKLGTMLL